MSYLGGEEFPADVTLPRLARIVQLHVIGQRVLGAVQLAAHRALYRLLLLALRRRHASCEFFFNSKSFIF